MNIEKPILKSLLVMADIIEARDPYTGGHVWRASQFAKLLATKVGLPKGDVICASIGGYLHDLGKVGIPDSILRKKAALVPTEFEIIKTHPLIGARLICEHPLGQVFEEHVLYHHERLDGKGYSSGIVGDHFPLQARIVGIADAFDAMTSTRSYRAALPEKTALSTLEQASGSQFDASLVGHMFDLWKAGDLSHIVGHSDEEIPLVTCPNCGPVINVPRSAQDGSTIYCRACGGGYRLHAQGGSFEVEPVGDMGTEVDLLPLQDTDVIEDLVAQTPNELSLPSGSQGRLSRINL